MHARTRARARARTHTHTHTHAETYRRIHVYGRVLILNKLGTIVDVYGWLYSQCTENTILNPSKA